MSKFMRKGKTKFYWIPTIASASFIPTQAEALAGTRLDSSLAEVNGFSFGNSPIDVPDFSQTFVPQINGEDSSESSSLVFYEDDTSNAIRTLLAKGTLGYIGIYKAGTAGASPATADKVDVWPVIVGSNAAQYSAGNEAAKYQVKFSNRAAPALDSSVT